MSLCACSLVHKPKFGSKLIIIFLGTAIIETFSEVPILEEKHRGDSMFKETW